MKQSYLFKCESSCRSHRFDGREIWTLTVRAKNVPKGLRFGPNARYADLGNKPAKAMLETLKGEPETFIFKNNGIMVVSEALEVEGNQATLTCVEPESEDEGLGHGVLNGGHTYQALLHALGRPEEYPEADRALVSVTVATGIPEEEIWTISRARNLSQQVPLYALRELAGDWRPLKEYLPPLSRSLVAFKPNDPEAPDATYDATDLVRRLALVNNELFPAQEGKHPVAAYNAIGSLARRYDQKKFFAVAPLLPDVLALEEKVVRHWESRSGHKSKREDAIGVAAKLSGCSKVPCTLLSGARVNLTMADPFVLPVVAAFRVFVVNGKWAEPLEALWTKYGPKTVEALLEAYKDFGRSSATFFGRSRSSWAAACELTKSVAIQNGLIKVA